MGKGQVIIMKESMGDNKTMSHDLRLLVAYGNGNYQKARWRNG